MTSRLTARIVSAALLLVVFASFVHPAAAAKAQGNMLVLACYDDYYDCKPPCNYKYCC